MPIIIRAQCISLRRNINPHISDLDKAIEMASAIAGRPVTDDTMSFLSGMAKNKIAVPNFDMFPGITQACQVAFQMRARCKVFMHDDEAALADLDRSIEIDPADSYTYD
jgi:hypothetical protein